MQTPSMERYPQVFAGMVALSLALVGSTFIGATALRDVKSGNDVMVVTGSAKRPIRSDYIIWRLSVSSQQPTAQAAYQDLKRQTERVQAYLRENQVPAEAVTLSAIESYSIPEVSPNGRETGQTLAYRLTQRFEVRSTEVDQYTTLSQQSTDLINEGINLVSESPQYLYTELSKLRIEMVAEATKDAKARAEAIAQSAGNRVGAVRSAETGVFQITSRNSTEVSDYGMYDTSSIEKDITAVVSVTFGIE
ncbi:SIMPL domain-containing protein [Thermoleptolyngbya sichuanensis XZ-Cy5]|uniref:SIMPL domain-containing protein n=1 Tax=Thermoleptolyngbya sichuanensis TaxID=2885951 RepID=UPI00240DFF4A|nr:SIMPL domain-containing protein [Thermoleptolyngbya sichuanensis]MDG2616815.1 SIMPL domain-containing protein [Thermoleptolyngbya sichuanensis XZ-Cy5]